MEDPKPVPKKFDEHVGSTRSPKWGAFLPDGRQAYGDGINVMAWGKKKDVQEWIDAGANNPYYPFASKVTWIFPNNA